MEKLRIIIAGSRIFNGYSLLKDSVASLISSLSKEYHIEIISGGAKGADKLGELFAHEMGYEINIFKTDCDKLGRRAGYVRNKKMAEYASEKGYNGMLIAFWDGKSKETESMINLGIKYFQRYLILRRLYKMGVDYYTCNCCGENFPDCGYYVSCESCGTRWCSDECAREDGYIEEHCMKHPELEDRDMMEDYRDSHCDYDDCCDCEHYESDSCKYCRKEDYDDGFLLCKALSLLEISREELINRINNERKL